MRETGRMEVDVNKRVRMKRDGSIRIYAYILSLVLSVFFLVLSCSVSGNGSLIPSYFWSRVLVNVSNLRFYLSRVCVCVLRLRWLVGFTGCFIS